MMCSSASASSLTLAASSLAASFLSLSLPFEPTRKALSAYPCRRHSYRSFRASSASFSSVAIVVSIVRIAGFCRHRRRARIAIRHSIRAIAGMKVVSDRRLESVQHHLQVRRVLSRRPPNRLPFLLFCSFGCSVAIARLPLNGHSDGCSGCDCDCSCDCACSFGC